MNAQHLIAKIGGFENWGALIGADDERLRRAHRRLDLSVYKIESFFSAFSASIFRDCARFVAEEFYALGFGAPVYRSAAYPGFNVERFNNMDEIPLQPPMGFTAKNPETGLYDFSMKIGTHFFTGSGSDLRQAKFAADKKARQFLCQEEAKGKSSEDSSDFVAEESEEWDIPHSYSGLCALWPDGEKARYDAEFKKAFPNWGRE